MSNYEQIQEVLEASKVDAQKFFNKGNSAAGVRLRKKLNEISKLCSAARKDIQEIKHTPALGGEENPY